MKTQKKGIQLNQAVGAVLTIIVVAILVIVSIYLFGALATTTATPLTSGSIVNETLTSVNEAGEKLAAYYLVSPACTVTQCRNATSNNIISPLNYTATNCEVKYSGTGPEGYGYNNSNWKCTYTFTHTADSAATNASNVMNTNFSSYPALVGLVGTIIFLALVIGVLVASFAFGGKQGV